MANDIYNGKERRSPLGGVSRSTFMANAVEAFGHKADGLFGLLYDMHQCTDSKIQLQNDRNEDWHKEILRRVTVLEGRCQSRPEEYTAMIDKRFIRRVELGGKTWPISLLGVFVVFGVICVGVGLGVLDITEVIDIKSVIRHYVTDIH